jgi:hypothetical protein
MVSYHKYNNIHLLPVRFASIAAWPDGVLTPSATSNSSPKSGNPWNVRLLLSSELIMLTGYQEKCCSFLSWLCWLATRRWCCSLLSWTLSWASQRGQGGWWPILRLGSDIGSWTRWLPLLSGWCRFGSSAGFWLLPTWWHRYPTWGGSGWLPTYSEIGKCD